MGKVITKWKAKNKTYVGYCHNKTHKGNITRKVMDEKGCCCKTRINSDGVKETYTCPFFKPNKDHAYWIDKEHAKIMRIAKKATLECGKLVRDTDIKEICKNLMWNIDDILDYIANTL